MAEKELTELKIEEEMAELCLIRHKVDDGDVDIRIWKNGDFKCRLFGFSYGEAEIISTLLSGCGYTVGTNDGMSKNHYDDFWKEDDSEKILNAVYPGRIKDKEGCARTRKKYEEAREYHRLEKERIEAFWAEQAEKEKNKPPFEWDDGDLPF